jgi:hypothetical protein
MVNWTLRCHHGIYNILSVLRFIPNTEALVLHYSEGAAVRVRGAAAPSEIGVTRSSSRFSAVSQPILARLEPNDLQGRPAH